jgi:hypothetical protein
MADVYRLSKAKKAMRKDNFPLLFIDEMLERLANHTFFLLSRWVLRVYANFHLPG